MQWDMIEELRDNNMEIGSHTMNHLPLSKLSEGRIWEELYASRCMLEDKIGLKIETLSLPYGDFNKRTIYLAKKAGYRVICTSMPGINSFKQLREGVLFRNSVNRAVDISTIHSSIKPTKHKIILAKL